LTGTSSGEAFDERVQLKRRNFHTIVRVMEVLVLGCK